MGLFFLCGVFPILFCKAGGGSGSYLARAEKELDKVTVTAEILNDLRGPKIIIQKYKNKTGYKKRQGFRAELTKLKVTGITKK